MSKYVKTKDQVYEVVEAGLWQAHVPIKAEEVAVAPPHRIKLAFKRPLYLHRQVLAFFEWTYETTKSEAMVNWFYSEELGWSVAPLPQKGHTGMAVELIADHPNRTNVFALQEGREMLGTDHHHCSAGAFQSHGDRSDELTKEGLHITIGNLDKEEYSIDARVSLQGSMTPCIITDWYEVPEDVQASLAEQFGAEGGRSLHREYLKRQLTTPSADKFFPAWWKDSVIKVETNNYQYGGAPVATRHNSADDYWRQYQGNSHGRRKPSQWLEDQFENDINKLCRDFGMPLAEVHLTLANELSAEPYLTLIKSMLDAEMMVFEAETILERMMDEARADQVADHIDGYDQLDQLGEYGAGA